uniref:Uncharacterized protein n=1 Tax=Manihot esculenta TaxID=3983 RepID=A0A2C9UTL2_MANES
MLVVFSLVTETLNSAKAICFLPANTMTNSLSRNCVLWNLCACVYNFIALEMKKKLTVQ